MAHLGAKRTVPQPGSNIRSRQKSGHATEKCRAGDLRAAREGKQTSRSERYQHFFHGARVLTPRAVQNPSSDFLRGMGYPVALEPRENRRCDTLARHALSEPAAAANRLHATSRNDTQRRYTALNVARCAEEHYVSSESAQLRSCCGAHPTTASYVCIASFKACCRTKRAAEVAERMQAERRYAS